jgi:hypothetical protein
MFPAPAASAGLPQAVGQFRLSHRYLPEKAKNQFFIDSDFPSVKIEADGDELRRMTVGREE